MQLVNMAPLLKYGQNIFFAPDSVLWPAEDVEAWLNQPAQQQQIILVANETRDLEISDDSSSEYFGQNISIQLAAGAQLNLTINHRGTHTTSISHLAAQIASNATINCREIFTSEESYHRLRFNVSLQGDNATFNRILTGNFIGHNRLDAETIINHQSPNTHSSLVNRLVLNDDSKAIVRDSSIIPKGMKDSVCSQDSRALLLSRTAEADMIPVLDIATDQVTASHAASISRPSAEQIEFMASRGLTPSDARQLAVDGFLNYGK